jgi:spore germination protein
MNIVRLFVTKGTMSMAIHTVKSGDTLWGISRIYGVSIGSIVEANGLNSADLIVPGLALYIPDRGLPVRFYQIKSGDTLWALARRFNTTLERIYMANPGLDPMKLMIGQRIRIPTPYKYRMETLGFVIPSEIDKLRPIFNRIAEHLTYLAVFSYTVNANGTLNGVDDDLLISESKRRGVKPLMVVTNWVGTKFDSELIGQILQSRDVRQTLIQNIVTTLRDKGYEGVSIDFEFIPPERRNDFTAFLRELKAAMGDLILHLNAHAKTSDDPTNFLTGAFDYAAIGQIVDIMAVMTIEFGYPQGPPNAIAPIWWVEQVIRYSVSQVDPGKLMIALPFYGYNWPLPDTPETTASVIPVNRAQNQAISRGVPIQYDWRAEAPWYQYWANGLQRVVWFEDPRSIAAKYRIMELYELGGATFWQLNYEFPQNWAYIEKNFQVVQ